MRIEIDQLRVRFGTVQAIDGVTIPFEPGEVAVLAGPNGAGKSTLFSVLLGLVTPDDGRILVDGVDVLAGKLRARMAFRHRLGYLPESVAFSENLTGRQVMTFFARARGVSKSRREEVLSLVGLAGPAGRPVRGYSRGMRQRLGLGIAILSEPELLVLDEPTGGLDQEGLSLLWDVLAEWRAAGRTVLVSTHDLALVERRADRVHVLSRGRVVASGSPDSLRQQTQLPVHVSVELGDLGRAEELAGQLSERLGVPVDLGRGGLRVEVAPADLLDAVRALDRFDGAVAGMRVEEPGLDEVYQRLLEG